MATCSKCQAEIEKEPNVGWVDVLSGDEGGTYNVCDDGRAHTTREIETKTCTGCGTDTDVLAMFPGDICLECYKKTPEANRVVTSEELVMMWGGRPVRRRKS